MQIDTREQDLLDDRALVIDQLRLQGHRGLLIEPQHVTVAERVARLDLEHLRGAIRDARRRVQVQRVMRLYLVGVARQRGDERAQLLRVLEQHDAPIGKDALNLIAVPDDLAAGAVERFYAFAAAPFLAAVNDPQRLGVALEHVHERALIVELLDRSIHFVEPRSRFLSGSVGGQRERDEQDRMAENRAAQHVSYSPVGPRFAAAGWAGGESSAAPTTFECTDVRFKREAYSLWYMT